MGSMGARPSTAQTDEPRRHGPHLRRRHLVLPCRLADLNNKKVVKPILEFRQEPVLPPVPDDRQEHEHHGQV